jgi:hypothetical protein
MKNIIIGLAGQAASGKDTVAGMLAPLIDEYLPSNQKMTQKAFAYNVKKIYCDYFDVDFDFIEKWKRIPTPPPGFLMPVRQALQMIGDGFRKVKPTVWIDKALNNPINITINDVRYINEAKAIKNKGGIVILIDRPSHRNTDQNDSEKEVGQVVADINKKGIVGELNHPDYPMFDYFLLNDGSISDLAYAVENELILYVLDKFS